MISKEIYNLDGLVFNSEQIQSLYEPHPAIQRLLDFALSFFRQIHTFFYLTAHKFTLNLSKVKNPTWDPNSRGLIVMIHGLNNSPVHWSKHLKEEEITKGIDLYAPEVLKRGNISADEAVVPILKRIITYVRQHPGKPVCLLGISNGGRLTTLIETAMRKHAVRTPVKLSNISGAHFGTSLVNLGNSLGLTYLLTTAPVREELAYGSEKAKEIVIKAQQPLPFLSAERDFEFYASPQDIVIPDLSSTLPKVGHPARYKVIHGHSHDSIVLAIAKKQMQGCVEWIDKYQPGFVSRVAASLLGSQALRSKDATTMEKSFFHPLQSLPFRN